MEGAKAESAADQSRNRSLIKGSASTPWNLAGTASQKSCTREQAVEETCGTAMNRDVTSKEATKLVRTVWRTVYVAPTNQTFLHSEIDGPVDNARQCDRELSDYKVTVCCPDQRRCIE